MGNAGDGLCLHNSVPGPVWDPLPSSDLPVISSVLPVFDGVFDSGIWFFILGAMIGIFAILGTMLTEATSE